MRMGQVCASPVICINRNATVADAAEMMRQFHVGTVVVVDGGTEVVPVGLVTDRDIVVGVVAAHIDPQEIIVSEIMNRPLFTARIDDDVDDIIRVMSARGVRRVPVVDEADKLVGIASQDDLYASLAADIAALATISRHQQVKESVARA